MLFFSFRLTTSWENVQGQNFFRTFTSGTHLGRTMPESYHSQFYLWDDVKSFGDLPAFCLHNEMTVFPVAGNHLEYHWIPFFFFSFDNMAFIVTVCLFIVFRFPPPWAYLLLVDCCHWHLFLLFEQAWHFVLLGGKDGHDGNWVYWDCSILICLSSWAYPGLAG